MTSTPCFNCGSPSEHDDLAVCANCGRMIARRYRAVLDHERMQHQKATQIRNAEQRRTQAHDRSIKALLHQGFTQPEGSSFVYYVLIGEHVKIGYSTNVVGRLKALRVPRENLLALEPGGYVEEQRRHEEFADLRVTQRWENFHRGADLDRHIEAMREQYGIPPWVNAPPRHGKSGPVTVRRVS